MDMSNHPTALILWQFYGTLLKELVVVVVVWAIALLWVRKRRVSRSEASHETLMPARNILFVGFGGLWVLAGLLQAQPAMSIEFVPHYLVPNLNGQPFWLFNLMEAGVVFWARHPIFWDTCAVWLQLGIGVAMLWSRDRKVGRIALGVGVVWSLWVWIMGEGLGGLMVPGQNSWLAGAPGASLLYGLAGVALLVPATRWTEIRVRHWMARGFTFFWGFLALLEIWPPDGYWTGRLLSSATLSMAEMPQPHWISAPVYATARIMVDHPQIINLGIVVVMVLLALGWGLWPGRAVAWATAAWVLLTWALCQDYGVFGGLASDPNTGLPVLIFVTAFLSLAKPQAARQRGIVVGADNRVSP